MALPTCEAIGVPLGARQSAAHIDNVAAGSDEHRRARRGL
jgi:hypothetical protein